MKSTCSILVLLIILSAVTWAAPVALADGQTPFMLKPANKTKTTAKFVADFQKPTRRMIVPLLPAYGPIRITPLIFRTPLQKPAIEQFQKTRRVVTFGTLQNNLAVSIRIRFR